MKLVLWQHPVAALVSLLCGSNYPGIETKWVKLLLLVIHCGTIGSRCSPSATGKMYPCGCIDRELSATIWYTSKVPSIVCLLLTYIATYYLTNLPGTGRELVY